MSKRVSNQTRYKYPLPIEPLPLPSIFPHPVTILYWAFKYLTQYNNTRFIDVEINDFHQILVDNPIQMRYLWEHGFFGTGQLSRSEPNWQERTMARLQLSDNAAPNLEYVTDVRRRQRIEFKKLRAAFESKKLEMRRRGEIDENILEQERLFLKEQREKELEFERKEFEVRREDESIIKDGKVIELESLQLMPVEAIFLTFALPVLKMQTKDLMEKLIPTATCYQDINSLIQQYVAYHHYRSKGWCVRSGIKFGCELLLYRRGPPFQHAEYGVMILDSHQSNDYTWYSTVARVVGGAKKNLVLCYVELQCPEQEIVDLWIEGEYATVFSKFIIHEILYKRWVAGKNRG